MSYALSGNTPNPIPDTNTSAAESAHVGVIIGGGYPWLDASLRVVNVSPQQAAAAADLARAILSSSGASVLETRWVAGGTIHARWKPSQRDVLAVRYATELRDGLLEAARRLGPNAQIILDRFRMEMPSGQNDLYIYPDTLPASSAHTTYVIASVGALATMGIVAVAIHLYQRSRRPSRNRRRSR